MIDGPFAETKEQLLGFYLIDVTSLEEACDVSRQLAVANPGGAYEMSRTSQRDANDSGNIETAGVGASKSSRPRAGLPPASRALIAAEDARFRSASADSAVGDQPSADLR